MSSRRTLKAAEAIREVVSMAILTEVRDPRVKNVTVTGVQVAPDMKAAKVQVTVMGDEVKQRLALQGLQNSAGFLQRRIADEIDTRYTPKLTFEIDQGVVHSQEIHRILSGLTPGSGKVAVSAPGESKAQTDAEEVEVDHDELEDEDFGDDGSGEA